jgi:iron complex outermembrane receptor protein
MNHRVTLVAGTACALLAGTVAWGQAAPPPSEVVLDDVVVTAQRRSERLTDVPASVAAVSAERIVATGAQDVADLGSYIPNVLIVKGSGLGAAVLIRGVGSNSRNIGFDSRVGVYLDGVYLGQSPALNQELVDLERVEVLRGPQGALFGKNTVAGAINLITAKPGHDFEAYASGRIGNYDARSFTGRVNLPLGERAALKVSLNRNVRDGFLVNLVDGGQSANQDSWAWRTQLRFDATERLDFLLSVDGLKTNENAVFGNVLTNTTGTTLETLAPGRREIAVSRTQTNDRNLWGAAFDATYRFDGDYALHSQTSYRRTKFHSLVDPDYSPADIFSVDFSDGYKQFIEELQFTSPQGRRLEYLVGLYYYRQRGESARIASTGSQGFLLFGSPNNATLPTYGDVLTRNVALFGNATYDLLENLELGLGFRLSHEKKSVDFAIDGSRLPVLGIATGTLDDSRVDKDFSPTATLTYKLNPRVSAYLRYAEGYKSGGYNLDFVSAASFPAGLEFDKETVRNYEAGLKGGFLDGRLSLSLAAFRTEYGGYQINQFRDLGGGRTAIVIGNASTVKTKGVELEGTLRPLPGLSISGGVGLLDAKFHGLPTTVASTLGGDLPGASKFQGNVSLDYFTPIGGQGLGLRANLTYTRRSGYYTTIDNIRTVTLGPAAARVTIPYGHVPAFDYVDARLALLGKDDRWEAALFGRNLANKTYVVGYDRDFFGTLIEGLGDPRTYGVELTARF